MKATKYRTKIIQFLLLACTLSPHGELSALAKSGKSRKTETEAQILDPAAERQKLIDTLSSDKHSQLASLPILGLACGARDNAVYLWPRERILLGFIVGEYGAILDDTEFSRCQQVINDLQSETARQSVLMARDPLYKNLQDYTIAHFEELKIRAANRQLSSEEFEFLCLIVESLLPSWRMGVSRQEQLNSLGTAFLEAYPNSRFRSEVIPLLHVYERTEAWPTEFALGYGFGAYQGTLRSYLSGLSYVQSDFHFYQRDFFLGWFSKLGFGTSGVRQAFGDSWQSGDMFETFLAMDFDAGYRIRIGNQFLVKPFAGFGFSLASRGLFARSSGDRSPSTAGDFGFNIGACFDFRLRDLNNRFVPKGEDPSYIFLRLKLDYHYFLVPVAGEVGDGIFYTSFQIGMMFNEYRQKSFSP